MARRLPVAGSYCQVVTSRIVPSRVVESKVRRPCVSYPYLAGYAAPETSTTLPIPSYAVVVTSPRAFVSATRFPNASYAYASSANEPSPVRVRRRTTSPAAS